MPKIQWTIEIDLGGDTEEDFVDAIISENEGDAIQKLANGKLIEFQKITAQQKKDYAIARLGAQYTQVYQNASDEKKTQAFRRGLQEARKEK